MSEKSKYDSVCTSCGCDQVEQVMWVVIKTGAVTDSYEGGLHGSTGYYCPECGDDNIEIMDREDYEEDNPSDEPEDLLTSDARANTLLPGGEW